MVAYSFNPRFIVPIRSGRKHQTIRLPRKRHARPGEMIQIYSGMRTKNCQKIIADPRCTAVRLIRLEIDTRSLGVEIEGIRLRGPDILKFAVADGFDTVYDMAAFWADHHPDVRNFEGVLIQWE